ncbi:MAG: hypothetical protein QOJ97_3008 [Solirubrobacteraceae bacterium]|nr:hypothetical protein [Solirubrobacteraceae bacterium]
MDPSFPRALFERDQALLNLLLAPANSKGDFKVRMNPQDPLHAALLASFRGVPSMRPYVRHAAFAVLVGVIGLGSAHAATPAVRWSPTQAVFAPGTRALGDVALGTRSQAIVLSFRQSGTPLPGTSLPEVTERPARGRPWGLPETIPTAPALRPTRSGGGQILLNRRGDALAEWVSASGQRSTAARRHGGGWSNAEPLPDAATAFAAYALGLADDGRVRAIGVSCDAAGACRTQTLIAPRPGAPLRPAGGEVGLPDMTKDVVVSIGAGGDALVAWRTQGPTPQMEAVFRAWDAAAWTAPEVISAAGRAAGPYWISAEVGEAGDAAVIWGDPNPGSAMGPGDLAQSSGIEVAVRPRGAGWLTPDVLEAPGAIGTSYRGVSVDANGAVLASWSEIEPDGATTRLAAVERPPGGPWEQPTVLQAHPPYLGSAAIPVSNPTLRAGRGFVSWSVDLGTNRPGLWFRDRGATGWIAKAPFELTGNGTALSAIGFDGSAISVGLGPSPARTGYDGLVVRDFTARPASRPVRISRVGVTTAGAQARIDYTLTAAGWLVGSVWRGTRRVRLLVAPLVASGRHQAALTLAAGRYRIYLAGCGAQGCRNFGGTLSVHVPGRR